MTLHRVLQIDTTAVDPTPFGCSDLKDFKDSTLFNEHEYDVFIALRKAIREIFGHPWGFEEFQDFVGKGVVGTISYSGEIPGYTWSMLRDWIESIGWMRMTHSFNGSFKSTQTYHGVIHERHESNSYRIKLYKELL